MAITAAVLLVVETRCLIRALVGSASFHTRIYAHIALMAAFGHPRAGTPELFSSVHCTDQDSLCIHLTVNTAQLSWKVIVEP